MWAAATGAKTNMANATDKTNNTDLRTVSPRFRLRIHDKDLPCTAARPIQVYGTFLTSVPIGESTFRASPCVCTAGRKLPVLEGADGNKGGLVGTKSRFPE
jgi:hypothetical protein